MDNHSTTYTFENFPINKIFEDRADKEVFGGYPSRYVNYKYKYIGNNDNKIFVNKLKGLYKNADNPK
jgi:hypothetical protein